MHPRLLLVALSYLTRLPTGQSGRDDDESARAVALFSLIGALLGGVAAFAFWATSLAFSPASAAVIAVGVTVLLTGTQPDGGMARAAQAVTRVATPSQRVSAIGHTLDGPGTLTLIITVLLRVALLAELAPVPGAVALVATGAISRGVVPAALLGSVPVGTRSLHTLLLRNLRPIPVAVALVGAIAICAPLLRLWTPAVVGAAILAALAVRAIAVRRFAGIPAGAIGAVVIITEIVSLALMVGTGAIAD